MYCDFYRLSERPFNVTPDPKFLYLNARYREAIASLHYGITQRKGFITLIGEAGTGKTTLLKKLLDELDPKTRTVFIFNTNVSFEEMLEYIFAEFDLPVHNGKKLYMLQRLNAFLLNELQNGGNVALLIDEAQDLEFSVLEDLRLLSNLETAKEKILQIVLSGQPELGQKLSNPVLRQLRQRIGINCRLLPLSREEISDYIRFRLQAAGCPDLKLFTREAEDQIYRFSHGIPRLVNVVCDNALVIGYALGRQRIGGDIITEAAADLLAVDPAVPTIATAEAPAEPDLPAAPAGVVPPPAPRAARWRARLGVLALVGAAVVVGFLSVGRTMLSMRAAEEQPPIPPAAKLEVIRPGSQPHGSGIDGPDPVAPPPRASSLRPAGAEAPGVPAGETVPAWRPVSPPGETMADEQGTGLAGGAPDGAAQPAAQAAGERVAAAASAPPLSEPRLPEPLGPRGPASGAPPGPAPAAMAAGGEPRGSSGGAAGFRDVGSVGAAGPPVDAPAASRPGREEVAEAAADDDTPQLAGVPFTERAVRRGDSLSQLAMQKYGQATPTILDMLKLANPRLTDVDVIPVGQTIRFPELSDGFPTLVESSGDLALLVYSSLRNDRAQALQKALRGHGFNARVTTGRFGANKPIYRVVVSGLGSRAEVTVVGQQLQRVLREDRRLAQLGE